MSWIANFMENDMTVTDGVVTLNQYNPFCYFLDYGSHWWTNGLVGQWFIGCKAPIKLTLGRHRQCQIFLKLLMVRLIPFFADWFNRLNKAVIKPCYWGSDQIWELLIPYMDINAMWMGRLGPPIRLQWDWRSGLALVQSVQMVSKSCFFKQSLLWNDCLTFDFIITAILWTMK